ncbi:type VI secretion system-associated protein TagO [Thalassorhabdomicrobium marinisediminis]|uniref:type VI secretion system-associated protein TagO n=1 Tax=Thalassorhabdomicrobium marinisediminis TaxID=2170577 RepID=UPI0024930ED7|nr:type VI secretion system-associated protein TagO [Thalassorhabdomicrobium marinisediminis]
MRAGIGLGSVALVLALAGTGAKAQAGLDVALCRMIPDPLARLACYDATAARPQAPALEPVTEATGKWQFAEGIDPDTGDPRKALLLSADSGGFRAPNLFVRCTLPAAGAPVLTVWIAWHAHLGQNTMVTTQFDSATATAQAWVGAERQTATFAQRPRMWLDRLRGANRLVAQITPAQAQPIVAHFDLRGLEAALQPMARDCGLA